MSAPIDHHAFGLSASDPLVVVATLWRGAMVERFAQIEFFIDRSIAVCVAAGLLPEQDAKNTLPRSRCSALMRALKAASLGGRASPAVDTLRLVLDIWDDRNALCHGRFKVSARSVTLQWTAYDKGVATQRTRLIEPVEMLRELGRIDALKTALGSRLGTADKVCRELAG